MRALARTTEDDYYTRAANDDRIKGGPRTRTKYQYGPYGEPLPSWSGSRFRYTGQIALPDVQLYHYKARVYDPVLGRFLQTDPIGYDDDANLYVYVGDDPVNRKDPSGTYGPGGSGWSDELWRRFDTAQARAAGAMEKRAGRLESRAAKLDEKGKDGAGELRVAASNLRAGAASLRSDGSDGKLAYALGDAEYRVAVNREHPETVTSSASAARGLGTIRINQIGRAHV